MHFATPVALLAGMAAAAPFSLPNGFPTPDASALAQIEKQAGGTIPNTPLPTSLKSDAVQALQIIAANEIFEVSYFSALLDNVTNSADGFTDFGGQTREYVIDTLTAIRAQEELHAIGANAILASSGHSTIGPCNYQYPTATSYKSAIALADTFTALVVGTLASVQKTFALDGGQAASALVPLIGSIIGQESQQDGFFRLVQDKVPSSSPFLTPGAGAFAFNAVNQLFIVPNSCKASSNVSEINVPTLATLALDNSNAMPQAQNETLKFDTSYSKLHSGMHIAYISGQNKPVVRQISNVGSGTFEAHFPFGGGFSNGLTIAALVNSAGPFSDIAAVANHAVAGPGLIQVN